jgi:hypothetical protein
MIIDPTLGLQIIMITGTINIILLILVFLSCRCMLGKKITEKLMKTNFYKKFYNYHCWYWRLFFISAIIHGILAFFVFVMPI